MNHSLGKFAITNIPPGPPGKWIYEITFKVDENNILKVICRRKDQSTEQSIEIPREKHFALTREEIHGMIA